MQLGWLWLVFLYPAIFYDASSGRSDSVSSWLKNDEDSTKLFSSVPKPVNLPLHLQGKPFLSVSAGNNFTAAIIKLVQIFSFSFPQAAFTLNAELQDDARGKQGVVTFGEGLQGQLGHKTPKHGDVPEEAFAFRYRFK